MFPIRFSRAELGLGAEYPSEGAQTGPSTRQNICAELNIYGASEMALLVRVQPAPEPNAAFSFGVQFNIFQLISPAGENMPEITFVAKRFFQFYECGALNEVDLDLSLAVTDIWLTTELLTEEESLNDGITGTEARQPGVIGKNFLDLLTTTLDEMAPPAGPLILKPGGRLDCQWKWKRATYAYDVQSLSVSLSVSGPLVDVPRLPSLNWMGGYSAAGVGVA
ncbi:hypothetical protein B0H16DRAFT_1456682 [Mycena metata]|uniref:Uncharacterized protein n=1 Tax=Mycena metata TaxID=1033252 RepID=A0AAD7J9T5_9AGAR|nr:hypothetical protein B0H16DRAFT_1456682 [Mycena metata]